MRQTLWDTFLDSIQPDVIVYVVNVNETLDRHRLSKQILHQMFMAREHLTKIELCLVFNDFSSANKNDSPEQSKTI